MRVKTDAPLHTLPVGEELPTQAPQALPLAITLPSAPVDTDKALAAPPNAPSARPHELRFQATQGALLAQIKKGDALVTAMQLPIDASQIDDAELDRLNNVFNTLEDSDLQRLLGDLDKKLGKVKNLAHGHLSDPLVSKKSVKKRAGDGHEVDKQTQTEKHARRAAATSEGVGHIAAPGLLSAGAEAVQELAHSEAAHIASHSLHVAAEALHVGAGVLDVYMAAKHAKHSPWHAAFHAARGALGFASIFVPALGIGVIAATVGKIGFDTTEGIRARRQLERTNTQLTTHLTKLVNEQLITKQ